MHRWRILLNSLNPLVRATSSFVPKNPAIRVPEVLDGMKSRREASMLFSRYRRGKGLYGWERRLESLDDLQDTVQSDVRNGICNWRRNQSRESSLHSASASTSDSVDHESDQVAMNR